MKQLITRSARRHEQGSAAQVSNVAANNHNNYNNKASVSHVSYEGMNWREKLHEKLKNEKSPLVHSTAGAAAGTIYNI